MLGIWGAPPRCPSGSAWRVGAPQPRFWGVCAGCGEPAPAGQDGEIAHPGPALPAQPIKGVENSLLTRKTARARLAFPLLSPAPSPARPRAAPGPPRYRPDPPGTARPHPPRPAPGSSGRPAAGARGRGHPWGASRPPPSPPQPPGAGLRGPAKGGFEASERAPPRPPPRPPAASLALPVPLGRGWEERALTALNPYKLSGDENILI